MKIKMRESNSIDSDYHIRISENKNILTVSFGQSSVRFGHFVLTEDCGLAQAVIEMTFSYTDRTDFIEKLWEWCCADDCWLHHPPNAKGTWLSVGLNRDEIRLNFPHDSALHQRKPHSLSIDFITNFKQKLKAALLESVVEEVVEKPTLSEAYNKMPPIEERVRELEKYTKALLDHHPALVRELKL